METRHPTFGPGASSPTWDITPELVDARLLAGCVDLLTAHPPAGSVDAVVGIDARGFIFAAAAAMRPRSEGACVRRPSFSCALQ